MTTWVAVDVAARELGVSTDELRIIVLERGLSRREGAQGLYAIRCEDLADLRGGWVATASGAERA